MKNKVCNSFADAVSDIPDGATVMMHILVGPAGVPQNLILALRDRGAKNLTVVANNFGQTARTNSARRFKPYVGPRLLVESGQVKKAIVSFLAGFAEVSKGGVEIELSPLGTLTERIRAGGAGLGGFYSPIGVDTVIAEGKERRVINGKEYVLEMPLRADFAFIRAHKADRIGNLTYKGVMRGTNPTLATAANVCIAEVDEIVEPGELDPENIITSGCFVDRIVKIGD